MRSSFVALVVAATAASTMALPAPIMPIETRMSIPTMSLPTQSDTPDGPGGLLIPSQSDTPDGPAGGLPTPVAEPTGTAGAHSSGHSGKPKRPWDHKHCTMTGEPEASETGLLGLSQGSQPSGFKRALQPITGMAEPTGMPSATSGKSKHPKHWDDKFCKVKGIKGKGKGKGKGHGHSKGGAEPTGVAEPSSGSDSAIPSATQLPGGSGSPSDSSSTLPPDGSGSTLPPDDSSSTLPPDGSGSTLPSDTSGSTLPPDGSGSTLPFDAPGSTMPPADSSSDSTSPDDSGASTGAFAGNAAPSILPMRRRNVAWDLD